MGIHTGALLKSIAHSVNVAYEELRQEGSRLEIPEVEIKLCLYVEVEGEFDDELAERGCFGTFINEEMLEERGLLFQKVGTARCEGQVLSNFELRATLVPGSEQD